MNIQPITYNRKTYRNYAYFVETKHYNLLVDAGNFEDIHLALDENQQKPHYILLTHSHHDHIDGASKLKAYYNAEIIASSLFQPTDLIDINEQKAQNLGLSFHPLSGHSEDSGLWLLDTAHENSIIFAGDVLFNCGCGRQFQGTDQRLLKAMQYINNLDANYQLYVGHDYTLANLEFCLHYFPQDQKIKDYHLEFKNNKSPLALSHTLEKEKMFNPFLRYNDSSLWQAISVDNALEFVIKLRYLRDQY